MSDLNADVPSKFGTLVPFDSLILLLRISPTEIHNPKCMCAMMFPETLFMIMTKVEKILFLPRGNGCMNSGVFIQCNAKNESALMGKNDQIES